MKYLLTLLLMVVSAINLNAVIYKNNYYNTQTELVNKSRLQSGGMYSTSYYVQNKPRRVKGYTADGDSIDTPGINPRDMWNPDYTYYYGDDTTPWPFGPYKRWFRKDANGNIYYWYNNTWNSGGSKRNFDERTTQYYKDKPQPIEDNIMLYILACVYLYYKIIKQNKLKLPRPNVGCKGV